MLINGQKIAAEVKSQLKTLYGDDLREVFLFGSYARKEADNESDVDVLIVLQTIDRYSQDVGKTSSLISSLSLKYGVSISRVFVSESDWVGGETPFLLNVRDEAIPA